MSRHSASGISSTSVLSSAAFMQVFRQGPRIGHEPSPGDLIGPDADPVLTRSGRCWSHRPEAHPSGGRTAWAGYVVGDSLNQHTPSDFLAWVPTVDLEAHICARRKLQFASGCGSKDHNALVEEVVDGEDERTGFSINHRNPAEVVCRQQFDKFLLIQYFNVPWRKSG